MNYNSSYKQEDDNGNGPCVHSGYCCSIEHPCGLAEGDCDHDDECITKLCGMNNCGYYSWDGPYWQDCCTVPEHEYSELFVQDWFFIMSESRGGHENNRYLGLHINNPWRLSNYMRSEYVDLSRLMWRYRLQCHIKC